ncbi:MAG TPA: HEPN domain-containing protein [Steroidobacteraceae bacterium]|nr:HEPN domain-containing protein [Steroidobacteraceae bacterium]
MPTRHRFTAAEGYTVGELLHYGFDHISSARYLLVRSATYFDSAGYLAHIGVELILKAWHLEALGHFENTHNLQELWRVLVKQSGVKKLSKDGSRTLALLDTYEHLRYPNPSNPIEIGSEHVAKVNALVEALWRRMPDALLLAYDGIDPLKKGGRVLMKRPKNYRGK